MDIEKITRVLDSIIKDAEHSGEEYLGAYLPELTEIREELSIPIEPPVKHDFADIVEEFKKRIDELIEKNEKAVYYNNGLRKAYIILQQVQDDMEL